MCRRRHSTSGASSHHESSALKFSEPILFHDGTSIHSPTNTALILENIKQEVESIDSEGTPGKMLSVITMWSLIHFEADVCVDAVHQLESQSLKTCKTEDDSLTESGETTIFDFASLLDSALKGDFAEIMNIRSIFKRLFLGNTICPSLQNNLLII